MRPPANRPKRHHYIPQMILRRFSDTDGQLWFWRREFELGDIRKTTPQNLFVESELYTIVKSDGAMDVSLEKFFADLEGDGDQFIRQLTEIVRNGRVPTLDEGAWNFWHHFFYYQMTRTPGYANEMAKRVGFPDQIQAAVDKLKADEMAAGKTDGHDELESQVYKNALIIAQAQGPSEKVLAILQNSGIAIYRITDQSKSFIIGDVPGATARIQSRKGSVAGEAQFFPLTYDIALGHLWRPKIAEIIDVDRDQIRRMNLATAGRSTVIAGRSHQQLASISKSAPYTGVTSPADVDSPPPL